MNINNFFENLANGDTIEFAQYKRDNGQLNFVDSKYYADKIAVKATNDDFTIIIMNYDTGCNIFIITVLTVYVGFMLYMVITF